MIGDDDMPLPQPQQDEDFSSKPFLKPKHVGKKGATLTITGVREAGKDVEFSDILVDVKLGPKEYTMGVRVKSGNYRELFERFGSDDRKWKGKKVKVAVKFSKRYKQDFVCVLPE
jgi:hypothetical protein